MAILTSYTPYKDGDVLTPDVLNDVVETAINANKITQTPDTSMVNQVGTPSVSIANDGRLIFANLKGEQGNPGTNGINGKDGTNGTNGTNAGFGTITATVDNSVGTPKVAVLTSGDNTAKNITFQFQNIKGEQGNQGTSVSHYWNGTTLVLSSASGTSSADLKGAKGDTGSQGPQGPQGPQGIPGSSDMAFEIEQIIYDGSNLTELSNSNITQGWYLIGFTHTFYDDEGYEEDVITQYMPIMISKYTPTRYYFKLFFSNSYQQSNREFFVQAQKGMVYIDTAYQQTMPFTYLARLK